MSSPHVLWHTLSGSPHTDNLGEETVSAYATALPSPRPARPTLSHANSLQLREHFFSTYGPGRLRPPRRGDEEDGRADEQQQQPQQRDDGSLTAKLLDKGDGDKGIDDAHPAAVSAAAVAAAPAHKGARLVPLVVAVAVGLAVRFAVPRPDGVTSQAWQLLAIFLSTITGLVLGPLPVGAWAFLGLTVAVATRTLPFAVAFQAFTSDVIWLIVISFFFARGFVKTGLGDRVATLFVTRLGGSTLGMAYGLTLSEALVLCPCMPSTTARAGGIFLPIIKSLAEASEQEGRSDEEAPAPGSSSSGKQVVEKETSRSGVSVGAYLVLTQFQASAHSSALFLTSAAQNLLCVQLAQKLGVALPDNAWLLWLQASCVPALAGVLTAPLLLYRIYRPRVTSTPDAPAHARDKLAAMGPVSRDEWAMMATMAVAVALWVAGDALLGLPNSAAAAMLALAALLLLGVLSWDDCLSEKTAWDTLAWFAVLVGMADALTTLGLVQWLSDAVRDLLGNADGGDGAAMSWPAAFAILHALYFLVHYLFASQTGHVGALYSAFLAMQLGAGVPPMLAALSLAFNTNLFGAITHYSSGQAAVYFAGGYVPLGDVFKYGAVCAVWSWLVWGVAGGLWWKLIGIY